MNAMKRCLRCGNFCKETSIFCENCQSSLLKGSEQKLFQTEPMSCPETKILDATKMIQEGDDIDSGPLALRPLPWVRRQAVLRRTRRILIVFALLFIVALIVDSILITLVLTHPFHIRHRGDVFPLLTLTPAAWVCWNRFQG